MHTKPKNALTPLQETGPELSLDQAMDTMDIHTHSGIPAEYLPDIGALPAEFFDQMQTPQEQPEVAYESLILKDFLQVVLSGLTPKEREVLRLRSEGQSLRDIRNELGIRHNNSISRIVKKARTRLITLNHEQGKGVLEDVEATAHRGETRTKRDIEKDARKRAESRHKNIEIAFEVARANQERHHNWGDYLAKFKNKTALESRRAHATRLAGEVFQFHPTCSQQMIGYNLTGVLVRSLPPDTDSREDMEIVERVSDRIVEVLEQTDKVDEIIKEEREALRLARQTT